jgi:hypothetical protein
MLSIARVLLAKPDIVILDEATSNVDTRTEMKITEAFQRLLDGKNQHHDRAPPKHHPEFERHLCPQGRLHRRDWEPRRPYGKEGILLLPVFLPVQEVDTTQKRGSKLLPLFFG